MLNVASCFNVEHNHLWRDSAHSITETILVVAILARLDGVLARGGLVFLMDHGAFRVEDGHIDVEEAALDHLKGESEFSSGDGPLIEALLSMGVQRCDVGIRWFDQTRQATQANEYQGNVGK